MNFKLSSPEVDKWNGEDKALHFALSALMASIFYVCAFAIDLPAATEIAFGASLLVGIAKELKDAMAETGSGFSYKDLVADALGSALGVAFAAVLLF